jgi:ribosome-binding protein aMBF1 (putative translation factor)
MGRYSGVMTMQQLTDEIAKAVNLARATRDISKNELADRVHPTITRTQLQRKLAGTKPFTIEELALISEILDWSLTDFLITPAALKQVAS